MFVVETTTLPTASRTVKPIAIPLNKLYIHIDKVNGTNIIQRNIISP